MVLDDVAHDAGRVVELPAPLDPDLLRHRDLDLVDVLPVPQRLEDRVAEAEDEDVLDGLLAEVVVDAEGLPLVEGTRHQAVELPRGGEVAAEGLLDHDPRPRRAVRRVQEARVAQAREDRREGGGRDREVEEPVAARRAAPLRRGDRLAERRPGFRLRVVARDRVDARRERAPGRLVHRFAGEALDRLPELRAVGLGRAHRGAGRDDAEGRGQLARPRERVEGRDDLAVREVAGRTEQDHRARVGGPRGQAGRGARRLDVQGRAHRVRRWRPGPSAATAPPRRRRRGAARSAPSSCRRR